MRPFQKILVAVDFSPASDAALEQAARLADAFGASVVVLHVYEAPTFVYPALPFLPLDDISSAIEKNATAGVAAIVKRMTANGRAVEGLVRQGSAWQRIEEVAAEILADLVVVGTHGRRGVARAIIGSVAERVVRTSRVPVLTVHAPELAVAAARSTIPTEPEIPSRDGACG